MRVASLALVVDDFLDDERQPVFEFVHVVLSAKSVVIVSDAETVG
jgi:cell division protein FtsL